ncbi:MAG: chloride channel protein [Bacteroidetes bacterium]|nr:chloride channel protein [Bacteroidota bacterium]MBL6944757.1 chloride channel protein [Bacteroidales bacterium]
MKNFFNNLYFKNHNLNPIKVKRLVVVLSIVIGLFSGLAAVLLKNTVFFTHDLITNGFVFDNSNYLYLAFPFIGISLTVIFGTYILRDNIGHGVSRILYAISRKHGRIEPHNTYSSMIGSTLTVAFGGSVGLEAPIVLTGSSFGSYLGRLFKLDHKTVMILIGAGATGAIAGIFKAPVAAVIFSLEVLMIGLTMGSLIPLLIAAATGASVAYFLMGSEVLFSFDLTEGFYIKHIPYYIGLGLLTGFVSLYFTSITLFIEGKLKKIKLKSVKVIIGGVSLGVLIFILPSLYGEGYEFLELLINNKVDGLVNEDLFSLSSSTLHLLIFLGLILIFKVVAMAITMGSGGVGGIFAPSLFMGGVFGFFYARLINLLPIDSVPEKNMALVGMAGVMAGVMHAPLTGIFLIAEITGGYELFTPLIITATISYLTIMYFEPYSIYTKNLAARGELFTHHKDKSVLQMMTVESHLETNFKTIDKESTLGELVKVIATSERNIIPVIDDDNNFYGLVFVNDIRNIIFNQDLYDKTIVSNLMYMPDPVVSPNESMEEVAQKFQETGHYNLPVIKDGKYLGFVSRASIFSTYRKLLKEFSQE